MPKFKVNNLRSLLAVLALSFTGCAGQWCRLPDEVASTFNQTQLGWEIQDVCNSCALDSCVSGSEVDCSCDGDVDCRYSVQVHDDAVQLVEPESARRPRIVVGPPPVPYEPPMPPKFLPVPSSSVFSGVSY